MVEIERTDAFVAWFDRLRDEDAKAKIAMRLDRVAAGNLGDVKSVGDGVSEMRIAYGPGYRLYFTWHGQTLIVLLCGGDKSSQRRDIAAAKDLLREIERSGWSS